MTFTFEKLLTDVMARLGETARPQSQTSLGAVPWPEDIIALKVCSMLPDVGGRLIREATLDMLDGGCSAPSEGQEAAMRIMPCGLYAAEVRLPDGFLRLVSVKLSGWRRGVSSIILPDAQEWSCQWSPAAGVAGCPDRPRVYLDRDGGGQLLRLVGSETAAAIIEWLAVCTVPAVTSEGEFDFPGSLYSSLVNAIVESAL